jgi:hypothetical protein
MKKSVFMTWIMNSPGCKALCHELLLGLFLPPLSYGDFAAISGIVDVATAEILKREVRSMRSLTSTEPKLLLASPAHRRTPLGKGVGRYHRRRLRARGD